MHRTHGLARRIRLARERAGFDRQTALAQTLGVDASYVSRWERGVVVPGAESLVSLADATGVTVDWLLTGREAA